MRRDGQAVRGKLCHITAAASGCSGSPRRLADPAARNARPASGLPKRESPPRLAGAGSLLDGPAGPRRGCAQCTAGRAPAGLFALDAVSLEAVSLATVAASALPALGAFAATAFASGALGATLGAATLVTAALGAFAGSTFAASVFAALAALGFSTLA